MLKGIVTKKGLHAINNAITSNGVFLILKEAKLNNANTHLPNDSTDLQDLPLVSLNGFVNSVSYDQTLQGLIIQCIFDDNSPTFPYNSCGVYDNEGNLLFYTEEHEPMFFRQGMTLRYYFYIPLYNNVDNFANVRIMLPQNRVVHHVYEFKVPSVYWKAQHNLLTPFVQFTVYDDKGQLIKESEYEAYVNPGFIYFIFKEKKAGYVSIQGEGYSMSIIQGEQDTKSLNEYYQNYDSKVDDNICWIEGEMLE